MLDLEFAHALNELLQQYPPRIHIKIIQEMLNMETNEQKLYHLKQFFFLKLSEQRSSLLSPLMERTKLLVGRMNQRLDA